MRGQMLWFNIEKGFGFIQTADDERLYVAENGFRDGEVPTGRCKGMVVAFDRTVAEGDTRAVDVHFIDDPERSRARLRHARGGSSL